MKKDEKEFSSESCRWDGERYSVIVKNKAGRHIVMVSGKEQTATEMAAEAVVNSFNKVMS